MTQISSYSLTSPQSRQGLRTGMTARISPDTVPQKQWDHSRKFAQRDGVSCDDAAVSSYVGNAAVARKLMSGGHEIRATIAMSVGADTPTGYE